MSKEPTSKPKYWYGDTPDKCELSGQPFNGVFYDARTTWGSWCLMCQDAFNLYGTKHHATGRALVGQGYGQRYELQSDGRWLKTAG
jgi:hypothetical protein